MVKSTSLLSGVTKQRSNLTLIILNLNMHIDMTFDMTLNIHVLGTITQYNLISILRNIQPNPCSKCRINKVSSKT